MVRFHFGARPMSRFSAFVAPVLIDKKPLGAGEVETKGRLAKATEDG